MLNFSNDEPHKNWKCASLEIMKSCFSWFKIAIFFSRFLYLSVTLVWVGFLGHRFAVEGFKTTTSPPALLGAKCGGLMLFLKINIQIKISKWKNAVKTNRWTPRFPKILKNGTNAKIWYQILQFVFFEFRKQPQLLSSKYYVLKQKPRLVCNFILWKNLQRRYMIILQQIELNWTLFFFTAS